MPEDVPYNEKELLHKVAEGDENAFGQLLHRYKHRVYTIAWAYTENVAVSEEVLQDVFLRIWKTRAKLRDINDWGAWLYSISRNQSLTALRQLLREGRKKDAEFSFYSNQRENKENEVTEQELQKLLQEALHLLSPQQRRVFELSRLQGLSREETAREMGIAKATVSVHLTIALRIVRSFLMSRLDFAMALVAFEIYF